MRRGSKACTSSGRERPFSTWDGQREPRGAYTNVSPHTFVAGHPLPECSTTGMVTGFEADMIISFLS